MNIECFNLFSGQLWHKSYMLKAKNSGSSQLLDDLSNYLLQDALVCNKYLTDALVV